MVTVNASGSVVQHHIAPGPQVTHMILRFLSGLMALGEISRVFGFFFLPLALVV